MRDAGEQKAPITQNGGALPIHSLPESKPLTRLLPSRGTLGFCSPPDTCSSATLVGPSRTGAHLAGAHGSLRRTTETGQADGRALPETGPLRPEQRAGLSESSRSLLLSLMGSPAPRFSPAHVDAGRCLQVSPTEPSRAAPQRTHGPAAPPLALPPAYLAVPMFRYWQSSRCLKVFLKVALQSA